ncbi:MAG: DNA double-strand break repair nuclease NurA [Candidatus Nitrosocaldus sp.]
MKTQLNLPVISDLSGVMDVIGKRLDGLIPSRMDMLNGKQVLFTNDRVLKPLGGWDVTLAYRDIPVHRLERVDVPAYVVAVDSSCILIGDTIDGSIYSAKSSIALSCNGKPLTHALIGPLLFYIQHEYGDEIGGMGMEDVKRMIRVRLERLIQHELASSLRGIILLVDGSLRHSIHEYLYTIHKIEDICRVNNNILVGLSKSTRLRYLDGMISLLSREGYPCYADVTALVEKVCHGKKRDSKDHGSCCDGDDGHDCSSSSTDARRRGSMSKVYSLLARLTANGLVFRVDLLDDPQRSLGILMANDAFHNGYPESLRIAHHTSVFTHTDLLCIKGFMKSRFNIREVDGDDIRRILLGRI